MVFSGVLSSVVKVVFRRWRSCGVHGWRGTRVYSGGLGADPQWSSAVKPCQKGFATPEADGILISDPKTRLKLKR